MRTKFILLFFILSMIQALYAKEYHVSIKGNDSNTGSETAPFKTIGKAAQVAYPGDVITVHAGTYRERIDPPRGGENDEKRIVYRAAPGERVEIKGSEIIADWQKVKDGVWKVVIPNSFFGDYNPYNDLIVGDWFSNHGRIHHTGEVFLNNKSLYEMETLDKVFNPVTNDKNDKLNPYKVMLDLGYYAVHSNAAIDVEGSKYTWYCENDGANTTIWANFHSYNPNKELVEISVRKTCFYPEKPGLNYITISGFHISQAATQWAAPTAEQVGMVATHWNKGWIIENNVVSNSKCTGITLGKERSTGHNLAITDGRIDGTLHYIEVIFRTLQNGWNKENIGSHIVRNNEIFACEQAGICGSMGAAFCLIENNHIHDIWTKRLFSGAEIAGIKFHAAIDTRIHGNRIHRSCMGIWLDWMAQGSWISRNLLYENDYQDIYFEVNHGPFLVDNNICCSPVNIWEASHSGIFAHNLFTGVFRTTPDKGRYTPYHLQHQTDVAGLSTIANGDDRFYNNLFFPFSNFLDEKTALYSATEYPSYADGNVYFNRPCLFEREENQLILPDFNPEMKLEDNGKEVYLSCSLKKLNSVKTQIVTSERFGKARLHGQTFEQPDGKPIVVDTDYFGSSRSERPTPGPFEIPMEGKVRIKVW